jgi:Short-chain dehydrogenases of various substrate specificities
MQIAIVTGASSGMGREFVKQIDKKCRLDEIWIIARREDRLNAVASLCAAKTVPLALDLLRPESIAILGELLEKERPDVRILVNAAGFGKIGTYRDLTLSQANEMIDLNCKAAVDITLLALPYMRRQARILEICSAASFQPLPGFNVYAATKSFLHSFSRGLRWELFPRQIKVTAVCPDWVDTEFIGVARESGGARAIRHFPFAASPKRVVACALFDSALGLPVSTWFLAFFHRFFAKFIPHEIIIAFWELLRRI